MPSPLRPGEQVADGRLLRRQRARRLIDDDHAAPVAVEHLPGLDAHGPGAEDGGALGHAPQLHRLAIRPELDRAEAHDRRDGGGAPGREDHPLGGVNGPVHLDATAPGQASVAAQDGHAARDVALGLFRVVPSGDHLVAEGEDLVPVLDPRRDAGHAAGLGDGFGRAQERLRGHAGPVGALAPHEPRLGHRDLHAGIGQPASDARPPEPDPITTTSKRSFMPSSGAGDRRNQAVAGGSSERRVVGVSI